MKTTKVKATFTIDGFDLHTLKELTREQRTTPSIVVGQLINQYIKDHVGDSQRA